MKPFYDEQDIDAAQQKEQSSLADMERQFTNETNHHSAREAIPSHYSIEKVMKDDTWNGLWLIRDKRGNPLPKDLDQMFTDVLTAINAIQSYLKQKEMTNV